MRTIEFDMQKYVDDLNGFVRGENRLGATIMPETDVDPACETQEYAMAKESAIDDIENDGDRIINIIRDKENAAKIQDYRFDFLEMESKIYTHNGRIANKAEFANKVLNLIDDCIENLAIDDARKEILG